MLQEGEQEMNEEEKYYDKTERFLRRFAGGILLLVAVLLVALFCLCAGGCTTTRVGTDVGDVRESYSYIAGGLESAVAEFDRGIARAESHSRGIQDEIERLDYLFGQYEQKALRLRDEVDSLRAKIKDAEKISAGRAVLNSGFYNSADSDIDIKD